MREGAVPRLCIACGRSTRVGLRLAGSPSFLASQLRALGLSRPYAEKLAGDTAHTLNVALCKPCARPVSLPAGSPPPFVREPESARTEALRRNLNRL